MVYLLLAERLKRRVPFGINKGTVKEWIFWRCREIHELEIQMGWYSVEIPARNVFIEKALELYE